MQKKKEQGTLPTNATFVFYELEQDGKIPKAYYDANGNKRARTPRQDVADALMVLRKLGAISWNDITDETREIIEWQFVASVYEYAIEAAERARIDCWDGKPAPLVICESRATKGVLERVTAEYLVPITATSGQSGGFPVREVVPALLDNTGAYNDRKSFYIGDHEVGGPGRSDRGQHQTLSRSPYRRKGFKRGERAARALGLRMTVERTNNGLSPIEVLIALPGAPGQSIDLVELLLTNGVEAVRAVILAATPFEPRREEIEEFENRGVRRTALDDIKQRYSLPPLLGLRCEHRFTDDGRIWLHKFGGIHEDKETGDRREIWEPISSPFGGLVLLATGASQTAYGLRVSIRTFTGGTNTIDFQRSELPQLGASGVRSALMSAGVRVANGGEVTIVEILKQAEPEDSIDIARLIGWRDGDAFMIPGGKSC
jgi:hypothetical protein